jgi:hypothetical protein
MGVEVTDDLKLKEVLKKGYRVAAIMGWFMAASVLLYAVVVEALKVTLVPFEGFAPSLDIDTFRYVFVGVSAVMFFLAKVVRNRILAVKPKGPATGGEGEGSKPYIQRLYLASIVTYFFCEVIAVCGLVLFFLGGKSADFYAFFFFSLVGFAVYFPRYARWEEWVRGRGDPAGQQPLR